MSNLIIHATVARHFDGPDGRTFNTFPGYIGEAPEWLGTNNYFQLCVSDRSITYVGGQTVSVPVQETAAPEPVAEPTKAASKK